MRCAGAVAIMLPLLAHAAEQHDIASVDARFDRTGDKLVDVSDWRLMTTSERQAYARASLIQLGIDPDALTAQGTSRLQQYLEGLNQVYK